MRFSYGMERCESMAHSDAQNLQRKNTNIDFRHSFSMHTSDAHFILLFFLFIENVNFDIFPYLLSYHMHILKLINIYIRSVSECIVMHVITIEPNTRITRQIKLQKN